MGLATTLTLRLKAVLGDTGDLTSTTGTIDEDWKDSLADGSAANQATLVFADSVVLDGAEQSYDLVGGGLVDANGKTLAFDRLKGVFIRNKAAGAGSYLDVEGSLLSKASEGEMGRKIGPNGLIVDWDPVDGQQVVAGTADIVILSTVNSGVRLEAEILLLGVGTRT